MKKKLLGIIIMLAVLISALVCTVIITNAEDAPPELAIKSGAVTISDSVFLTMKVEASGVEFSDVKLLVWDEPRAEYLLGTEKYTVNFSGETDDTSGKLRGIYHFRAMSAKMMADNFYFVAYANVEGEDCYSPLIKYSALQYAYNKLGKTGTVTTDENLETLLYEMLDYGAAAQVYLNHNADRPANADWYQVKLTEGKLFDGTKSGLFLPGDTVVLTAPEANESGVPFAYWQNSEGAELPPTENIHIPWVKRTKLSPLCLKELHQ